MAGIEDERIESGLVLLRVALGGLDFVSRVGKLLKRVICVDLYFGYLKRVRWV